jgi:hypothetical protein
MNTSMCTKMKRQVIDANAVLMEEWGQTKERGLHVDGASVLCFIEVPDTQVVLSEKIRAFRDVVRSTQ